MYELYLRFRDAILSLKRKNYLKKTKKNLPSNASYEINHKCVIA